MILDTSAYHNYCPSHVVSLSSQRVSLCHYLQSEFAACSLKEVKVMLMQFLLYPCDRNWKQPYKASLQKKWKSTLLLENCILLSQSVSRHKQLYHDLWGLWCHVYFEQLTLIASVLCCNHLLHNIISQNKKSFRCNKSVLDKVLHIPFSKGKSQNTGSCDASQICRTFHGNFHYLKQLECCYGYFSTTILFHIKG